MKILCVSDTVMPQMENATNLRRQYADVDLLLSCGDLPPGYLEFITSILNVPLFYVCGNHDEVYQEKPPGGEDLHGRLLKYKGLSFYGLEGSMRYNSSPLQYSNAEMEWMVMRAGMQLGVQRGLKGYGVDVFVVHSPPKGIHDAEDLPHNGFSAFLHFMAWYRPRYLLHGHVHTWDRRTTTATQYQATSVMNINPVTLLTIDPLN